MKLRRTLLLGPAVTLCVALAACGSNLDPATVAAANGGGVVAGAGTGAQVLPDGTVVAGGSGVTDPGSSGGGSAAGGGTTGGAGGTTGGSTGGATGGTGGTGGGGGGTGPVVTGPKGSCDGFKNSTGITDSKIVIANVSDLSGPQPGLFQTSADAVRAFAMYFNASSDICGRKLEVLGLDSRTDAGADQQAYAKACDSSFAVIGAMSAFDSGGAATAQKCGIPDLRAASVTPERSSCLTCFGTQSVNSSTFQNAVPDFVKRTVGASAQKGAFLYLNAGAAATNAKGQIKAQERRGIKFIYTQGIDVSEFNYAPYVQQMKDRGVKYLQYLGSYQTGVRLAQAMQSASFKPDLFLFDPVAYDRGFIESGGGAVEGAHIFMNFTPFEEASASKEMQLYLQYLQQVRPGAAPTFFGVYAWSAARLFVQEATALGGRLTRETLIERITAVKSWTGNGMHSPQYVGAKKTADCWRFLKVSGGKFVPASPRAYNCAGTTPAT